MASTINEQVVISAAATVEETRVSKGLRIARYCALEELPGLVFGVMTVAYIVLSLVALAH
ncbi:MAG: hypothetical protein ACLQDV_11850 [Candidatus Binataceae bacterium]